jgi:hypothetical protein
MDQYTDLNNNIIKNSSNSSINLNKYKIFTNNSNSKIISSSQNISNKNLNKNINMNITQDIDNQTMNSSNVGLRKYKINIQSNNISEDDINKSNYNNIIPGIKNDNNIKYNTIIIPNYTYFDKKPKNEKESRRMLIEYIKLLRKKDEKLEDFLNNNKISPLILQQEKEIIKIQNPNTQSNLFTSGNNSHYELSAEYTSIQNSSPNLFDNIIFDTKEKISFLNFLSLPRIMNIIIDNVRKPYAFFLSPKEISYINGIEEYIFKWIDIKDININNNFNLILLVSCEIDNEYKERFIIEFKVNEKDFNTFTIKIEASSKELCESYVFCLNYLSKYCKGKNKF